MGNKNKSVSSKDKSKKPKESKGKKDKSEELDEIFKDMKNPAVAKKLLKKYLLELLSFDTEVQRMVKQIALTNIRKRK